MDGELSRMKPDEVIPLAPPAAVAPDSETTGSRIPGFYRLSVENRRLELRQREGLEDAEIDLLAQGALTVDAANHIVENVVGTYTLPLGLGLNFQVNGRDYLVPMCVEEPSVIAAASNAARMVRGSGGFQAEADPPVMIAQVQLIDVPDAGAATAAILAEKTQLLAECDAAQPGLLRRGGGARDLEVRVLEPSGAGSAGMLVVHILADCRDAMGANLVNTMAEAVAGRLATLSGGQLQMVAVARELMSTVGVVVEVPEELQDAAHYGWTVQGMSFDWATLRDTVLREVDAAARTAILEFDKVKGWRTTPVRHASIARAVPLTEPGGRGSSGTGRRPSPRRSSRGGSR